MFKKQNKISFIVDENNDLYIEVSENKKDGDSAARLARLISFLETGNLHDELISAIHTYAVKNNRQESCRQIIETVNKTISEYNEKLYKRYVENKVSNKRDPIITPDLVLTTFKSSINT